MTIEKLDKSRWQAYFASLSNALVGTRAEIEIDALALGSQIEAEWLPLLSIAYDHRKDLIEIILEEGVEHRILRPQAVYADSAPLVASVEIIDSDDVRCIVRFRDPLMLPQ